MDSYREMLTYIKSAVTRNYSEKCINNIMDFVSGSASQNFDLLQEFYQTTLKALEEAKNEVRTIFLLEGIVGWLLRFYLCSCQGSHSHLIFTEVVVQDKSKTLQNLV